MPRSSKNREKLIEDKSGSDVFTTEDSSEFLLSRTDKPSNKLNGKIFVYIVDGQVKVQRINGNLVNLPNAIKQLLNCEDRTVEQIVSFIYLYYQIDLPKLKLRTRKVMSSYTGVNQIEIYIDGHRLYMYTIKGADYSNWVFFDLHSHGHNNSKNWRLDRNTLLQYIDRIES